MGKVTEATFSKSKNTINANTLDSILAKEKLVSIVKIDVEGFEEEVLKGSQKIIKKFHPDFFIESHTDTERKKIFNILEPHGYHTIKVFNASPTYYYSCQEPEIMQKISLRLKRYRVFRRA